jgi:phosphonate transport system substrate-binding protein
MPVPPRPPSARFRFQLPPSAEAGTASERARLLERVLSRGLDKAVEVTVAKSYESLAVDLLAGRTDAAWAPPFTCARVEAMGVRVVCRAVRRGASTYRSALLTRASAPLKLSDLSGKRALWVDRDSVGGFLLAKAFLKGQGIDGRRFFSEEIAGSYRAALEGVLEGRADVTAAFAPNEGNPLAGVELLLPGQSDAFSVVSLTEASPNDGVVVAMSLSPATTAALEQALRSLPEHPEGRELLADLFHADGFEPAPRLSYRALYRVALASA